MNIAARMGHVFAQYYVGLLFEHGYGVSESCVEAVRNYRAASEKGPLVAGDQAVIDLMMGKEHSKRRERFGHGNENSDEGSDEEDQARPVGGGPVRYELGLIHYANGASKGVLSSIHNIAHIYDSLINGDITFRDGSGLGVDLGLGFKDGRVNRPKVVHQKRSTVSPEDSGVELNFNGDQHRQVLYEIATKFWNRGSKEGDSRALVMMGDYFYYHQRHHLDHRIEDNTPTAAHQDDYVASLGYYIAAADVHEDVQAMYSVAFMYHYVKRFPPPRSPNERARSQTFSIDINRELGSSKTPPLQCGIMTEG